MVNCSLTASEADGGAFLQVPDPQQPGPCSSQQVPQGQPACRTRTMLPAAYSSKPGQQCIGLVCFL